MDEWLTGGALVGVTSEAGVLVDGVSSSQSMSEEVPVVAEEVLVGVASEAEGEEVPVEDVVASEVEGEEVQVEDVVVGMASEAEGREVLVDEVFVGVASEAEGEEVPVGVASEEGEEVVKEVVVIVQSMSAGLFAGLSTRLTSTGLCDGGLVFWRLSAMRSPGAFKVRD